jgi:hypothetical protein
MNLYTISNPGIQFPLQQLEVYKEEDGWIVLRRPAEDIYLSVQFCNHFFSSVTEAEAYLKKEIQVITDAGDLYHFTGFHKPDKDTITAIYFQYINNITHMVFVGVKCLAGNNGYWYMAVTKDEMMTEYCEPIFLNSKRINEAPVGQKDKITESKLANHTLKYMSAYNSDWGSGGGMSTEKFFSLSPDNSFKYRYSSVVSFGSLGGNTSQDEGWGFWEIQQNREGRYLVLRWHLKGNSVYNIQLGEPGIIFLGNEKYLVD